MQKASIKVLLTYSGVAVTTMFILLSLNSCKSKPEKEGTDDKFVDTKLLTTDPAKLFLDSTIAYWKAYADNNLTRLLEKFNFEEDTIPGVGWYKHKSLKGQNETHIEIPVSSNGYMYLKTLYAVPDWVSDFTSNRSIDVKVGDITVPSSYSTDQLSGRSIKEYQGKGEKLVEVSHLTDPMQDGLIILLMTSNIDKNIVITFEREKSEDVDAVKTNVAITLDSREKEIITDCFLLSQCIAVTKNTEVANIDFFNKYGLWGYLIPIHNESDAAIKSTKR